MSRLYLLIALSLEWINALTTTIVIKTLVIG